MKAREYLKKLESLKEFSQEDFREECAALRELDGLAAQAYMILALYDAGMQDKQMLSGVCERLRQAGYGEK